MKPSNSSKVLVCKVLKLLPAYLTFLLLLPIVNAYSQCGDPVILRKDYCPGQPAVFILEDDDPVKYRWYTSPDGGVPFYGVDGDGREYHSTGIQSGAKNFYYQKEVSDIIGPEYQVPLGGTDLDYDGTEKYIMQFDNTENFVLNSVTVVARMDDPALTYGLAIRYNNGTDNKYSSWVEDTRDNFQSIGGDYYKVTIPLKMTINIGSGQSLELLTSASDDHEPVEGMYWWDELTYGGGLYIDGSISIDNPVVSGTSRVPLIMDWDVTLLCSITPVETELAAVCCTDIGEDFTLTSPIATPVAADFPITLTASGADIDASMHYYWYDSDGKGIIDGPGLNTLEVNEAGQYTLKVVNIAGDETYPACYASRTIVLGVKSIFAPDDFEVCLGDPISLFGWGAEGKYDWYSEDPVADSYIVNENTQKTDLHVLEPGEYTYYIEGEVKLGNIARDGKFEGYTDVASRAFFTANTEVEQIGGIGQYRIDNEIYAWGQNHCPDDEYWQKTDPLTDDVVLRGNIFVADAIAELPYSETMKPFTAVYAEANPLWQISNQPVEPNTCYEFTADISNWHSGAEAPDVMLVVNGEALMPTVDGGDGTIETGPNGEPYYAFPEDEYCTWETITTEWCSGSNTMATVTVAEVSNIKMGHEFSMDDVTFSSGRGMQSDDVVVTVHDCNELEVMDDATACLGDEMELSVTTNTGFFLDWTDASGKVVATEETATVYPVADETYTARVQFPVISYLYNGDFADNVVEFSTDLTMASWGMQGNQYWVGTGNTDKLSGAMEAGIPDHTTGTVDGMMMIMRPNNGSAIFSYPAAVEAGEHYGFSFWLHNMNPVEDGCLDYPLNILVGGTVVKSIVSVCGGGWTEYTYNWEAPATETVDVEVVFLYDKYQSSGIALDDIKLARLGNEKTASVSITAEVCNTMTLTDDCNADDEREIYYETDGMFMGWYDDANVEISTADTLVLTDLETEKTITAKMGVATNNRIANGDFENGDDGSFSLAASKQTTSKHYGKGQWNILNETGAFSGGTITSADGNYLFVNPDSKPDYDVYVSETTSIQAGSIYQINFDFILLYDDLTEIDGTSAVDVYVGTDLVGSFVPEKINDWQNFSFLYTAPADGNLSLNIKTNSAESQGLYYIMGLDNISMRETFVVGFENITVLPCTPPCNKPLDIIITPPAEICSGDDIILQATYEDAGFDVLNTSMAYVWYVEGTEPGAYTDITGTDEVAVPDFEITELADAATYILRVEDGTEGNELCYTEQSVDIAVMAPISLDLGDDISICEGETATIDAGDADSYAWSTTETTQEISTDEAGTFTATITKGVCEASDEIEVIVKPLPVIELGDDVVACKEYEIIAPAGFDSYEWNNSETTESITVTASGDYSVTVTQDGCVSEDGLNVDISNDYTIDFGDDQKLCGDQTVTLDALEGDSYAWSTGETTQTIDVTSTGTYSVTVSNGACEGTGSIEIQIDPFPVIDLGEDVVACQTHTIDAGAGFDTYAWSNSESTQTVEITEAGDYTVTVSQNGCESEDEITVTINQDYEIDLGEDIVHCGDTAILLDAAAGDAYTWSNGETTQEISVSASGTYSVVVDNGVCQGTGEIDIEINPIPVIDLGEDIAACETYTINAGAGFDSYVWSTGETTQSIEVTTTDDYIVTVSQNGCESQDEITVAISNDYEIDFGNDQKLCGEHTIPLDALDGDSYIWSSGETTQTIEVTTTGTYAVTVTNGACEGTGSVDIQIDPFPAVDLGNDVTACKSYTIDAGAGFESYIWAGGETSQTIDVTVDGDYAVTVSQNGCESEDEITVAISNDYIIDFGDDIVHCGDTTILLDAGEGDAYTWSNGETTQTIEVTSTGAYSVVVNNGVCQGTGEISIEIKPVPVINLGDDIADCESYIINAGTGFDSYEWSTGETSESIEVTAAGDYVVTVTTDGCSASDEFYADITQPFTVSLGDDIEECEGTDIVVDAGIGDAYAWSNGTDTKSFAVTETGTYTVTVTQGNCVAEDEIAVNIIPNVTPEVAISADQIEVCEGTEVNFIIESSDNLGASPLYQWQIDGDDASTESAFSTAHLLGIVEINLIATSSERCVTAQTAEASIEVLAKPNLTPSLQLMASETEICEDETIDFTIQNVDNEGDSPSYEWFINGTSAETGLSFTPTSLTDNDEISVMLTSSEECVTAQTFTDAVTVSVYDYPEFTLGEDLLLCSNETATLKPSPEFALLWNDGSDGTEKLVEAPGGVFIATADNNGCTYTDEVTVEFTSMPNYKIDGVEVIYDGDIAYYEVSVEFAAYLWNTSDQKRNISVNPNSDENYWVMVEDDYNCRDTAYKTLKVLPRPEIGLDNTLSFCEGDSEELTVQDDFEVYEWSTGESTKSITVTTSGEYTVKASRTNPDITIYDTIQVDVIPNPEFTISDAVDICAGESATVGTELNAVFDYEWDTGETTHEIAVTETGDYDLTVTAFGCTTTKSVSVTVHDLPAQADVDPLTAICYYDELPVLFAMGENIVWYDDFTASTMIYEGSVLSVDEYLTQGLNEGASQDFFLQTNNEFCKSELVKATVQRNSRETELTVFTKTDFCVGDENQPFIIDGLINDFEWEMENADLVKRNDNELLWNFDEVGELTFNVSTTDDNGCLYSTSGLITVHDLPHVDFIHDNDEGKVTFSNISDNEIGTEYYWKLPDTYTLNRAFAYDTIISLDYGFYEPQLKAISRAGCEESITQSIFIDEPMTLFVPTAFTPDHPSEGINKFKLVGMNLARYEISVYDNFNNLVWYSTVLDENGAPAESWDGTHNDTPLKSDVYKWKIKAQFINGEIWTNEGDSDDDSIWGTVFLIR